MANKESKQANLITVDVDAIFEAFLAKSGWKGADLDEESKALGDRIGRMKDEIEALTSKIAMAEAEMATLADRESMARSFLEDAAKQMGKFASEPVLLTALQEEFPSAKPKRGRKAGSPPRVKATPEQIRAVLEAVDSPMPQSAKEIAATSGIDQKIAVNVLKKAVYDSHVVTSGQRRGLRYHLPAGSDVTAIIASLAFRL